MEREAQRCTVTEVSQEPKLGPGPGGRALGQLGLEVSWVPPFTLIPVLAPVTPQRPGNESTFFRFSGFSGWRNMRI